MRAFLRSVRIAPKKANLIAKLVRGRPVPEALETLHRTPKKGARLLEQLIRSAAANASHNDRQDPQMMIVRTLTVNKAQTYHRGVPMARGRMRPMRKFLSHITVVLGYAETGDAPTKPKKPKKSKKPTTTKGSEPASQQRKTPVQTARSKKAIGAPSSVPSASSASSASS
jgi:large subunit ribosomal protein L22